MKRKLTVFITVLLMGLLCAVTAFAAPYQNYNYHKGLVSTEPQAYVPYKVIDAVSMGVQTNMDDGFKNPEDMDTSAVNGDMAIADTGNSRVVIIDKSYKLKQYISNKTVQTVQEPVLDEEGNPVLDENGQPTYTETTVEISGFEFNGKNYTLSSPSGVTFAKDGSLYICDTGNARIIRFEADENGQYVCVRIFEKPAGLDELLASDDNSGSISADTTAAPEEDDGSDDSEGGGTGENKDNDSQYKPLKVAIADGGNMYVVSKGNHKGLIELSSDGSFTKFTGATKVKQTLSNLLRRILSDAQKEGLTLNLSTEYSNVTLDGDGMIFGTINALEAQDLWNHFISGSELGAPIKRIAPTGSDILKRNDDYPPSGDASYSALERKQFSSMVDIAVASDGIYSALDNNKGRIFTYNNEGELLFIFGAKGSSEGAFTTPVAINLLPFAAVEDGIVTADDPEAETYKQMIMAVLDSTTAQITLFKPTEYGKLIRSATMCQQNRQYDEAVEKWNKVLDQASNSRLAYKGIGRIQYVRGQYEEACKSFERAYDQSEYGTAYAKLRNERMETAMPWVMTALVVLVVFFLGKALFNKIRRFIKTGGKSNG